VGFSEIAFLLDQGQKDAAPVKCKDELEKQMRTRYMRNSMHTFLPLSRAGEPRPKKAEWLHAELASINVYGKLDQKHMTSWLDLLWNKTVYGDYHEENAEQVSLMIRGVHECRTPYPASRAKETMNWC